MNESMTAISIAIGIGLAVAMLVAGVGVMRAPVTVARGRVRALVTSDSPYAQGFEGTSVRRYGNRRFGSLTDGLGRRASEGTLEMIERSGLPLRVGEYVALRLAAIVAGGFLGALLGSAMASEMVFVLAVVGVVGGFAAPPAVLGHLTRKRARAVEEQLVELCELMSSMLRGGYGYVQALSTTAEELGAPLGPELARLVDAVRVGADVDEELARLNRRLNSVDFEMLATAITIQRRSGGNLAEILQGVAETIRFRQSFKREVAALTAQARYSAVIVAGIPVVLVIALSLMDPERYRLLFTDPIGRLVLGAAIVMDLFGYFVIKQVSKVEA